MRSLHLRFGQKHFYEISSFAFRVNLDLSWCACGGPLLSTATIWYICRWPLLQRREKLMAKIASFCAEYHHQSWKYCRRHRRCRRRHHHLPGSSFLICEEHQDQIDSTCLCINDDSTQTFLALWTLCTEHEDTKGKKQLCVRRQAYEIRKLKNR